MHISRLVFGAGRIDLSYRRKDALALAGDFNTAQPRGSGHAVVAVQMRLVKRPSDVRFGSLADIRSATSDVRFTPNSDRKSGFPQTVMSALPQADIRRGVIAPGSKPVSVTAANF
jgi:hypothetical protein